MSERNGLKPTVRGVNVEDFNLTFERDWLVAGGAEKVAADDGRPKRIEGVFGPFTFKMRKGGGHTWTRFCEDCVFLCVRPQGLVAAVFDGVSGDMDGSGGIASRTAAMILSKYVDKVFSAVDVGAVFEQYREECLSSLGLGATTAVIFVYLVGGKNLLFSKGDSICYADGKMVNRPDSIGNMLLKVLNDENPFSRYEVVNPKTVELCSDGISNDWDDMTTVELRLKPS